MSVEMIVQDRLQWWTFAVVVNLPVLLPFIQFVLI
jgi:hypothetical protein